MSYVDKMETPNCTAIVVDDDEDTVNLFSEFLEICNIKVTGIAFNGKEAERKYRDFSPNIVFSDVMMPEYDGFYALENIKKINSKAIVVMITGDVRTETISKLEELGADAIIFKPFDMKVIIKTVNNLMTRAICTNQN